jgi:hypothetical protein
MEKKKIKVYCAGKLNDDAVGYIKNCHKMILTAKLVRDNGYSVYVPCNDFLEGIVSGEFGYEDYFMNSQPWLEVSNALFLVPGWGNSSGTRREIERADVLNIPIFSDIDKMNEYFSGVKQTSLF